MPKNGIEPFLLQNNVNVTPSSQKRKVGAEDLEDDEVKRQKSDDDPQVVVLSSPEPSESSQHSTQLENELDSPCSNQLTPKCTPKRKRFKLNSSSKKKSSASKEETRRLREAEKAKREKDREEEKLKKEAERLKREAEKKAKAEEKQKERDEKSKQLEDKKKKAEAERLAKIEEKRAKEEEKSRKLEEKQKAEEEKKKAQEEEKKKVELKSQKQAQMFKGFFVARSTPSSNDTSSDTIGPFKPFQLAKDQTLAPVIPAHSRDRFSIDSFDKSVSNSCDVNQLYIKQLSSGQIKPFKTGKKLRLKIKKPEDVSLLGDDVITIDDPAPSVNDTASRSETYVCKYLGFHENDRPAWFGTWRKTSSSITGRRPFSKDDGILNYEVDSEDEWEPEDENGESLAGSDEDEPDDDYDIDNEFLVPHGYLSDEGDEENAEGENFLPDDPCFRERDMVARKNMRFKQLKPIIIGPVFKSHPKLLKYALALNRPFLSM